MVKFGAYYESVVSVRPEWRQAYINYHELNDLLGAVKRTHRAHHDHAHDHDGHLYSPLEQEGPGRDQEHGGDGGVGCGTSHPVGASGCGSPKGDFFTPASGGPHAQQHSAVAGRPVSFRRQATENSSTAFAEQTSALLRDGDGASDVFGPSSLPLMPSSVLSRRSESFRQRPSSAALPPASVDDEDSVAEALRHDTALRRPLLRRDMTMDTRYGIGQSPPFAPRRESGLIAISRSNTEHFSQLSTPPLGPMRGGTQPLSSIRLSTTPPVVSPVNATPPLYHRSHQRMSPKQLSEHSATGHAFLPPSNAQIAAPAPSPSSPPRAMAPTGFTVSDTSTNRNALLSTLTENYSIAVERGRGGVPIVQVAGGVNGDDEDGLTGGNTPLVGHFGALSHAAGGGPSDAIVQSAVYQAAGGGSGQVRGGAQFITTMHYERLPVEEAERFERLLISETEKATLFAETAVSKYLLYYDKHCRLWRTATDNRKHTKSSLRYLFSEIMQLSQFVETNILCIKTALKKYVTVHQCGMLSTALRGEAPLYLLEVDGAADEPAEDVLQKEANTEMGGTRTSAAAPLPAPGCRYRLAEFTKSAGIDTDAHLPRDVLHHEQLLAEEILSQRLQDCMESGERLKTVIAALWAEIFSDGDVSQAKDHIMRGSKVESPTQAFRCGMLAALILAAVLYWLHINFELNPDESTMRRWELIFPVFRLLTAFSFFLCMWAVDLYVFKERRINYLYVFEFAPRDSISWLQCMEYGLLMLFLVAIAANLYVRSELRLKEGLYPSSHGFPEASPYIFPAAIIAMVGLIVVPPRHVMRTSRAALGRVMFQCLKLPFVSVRFVDFFVADWGTSVVQPVSDLLYTACYFTALPSADFGGHADSSVCHTVEDHYGTLLAMIPYYWRAWQTILMYRRTNNRAHVINHGKYISCLLAMTFETIKTFYPDSAGISAVTWFFHVGSQFYCYVWDILMDWGWIKGRERARMFPSLYPYIIAGIFDFFARGFFIAVDLKLAAIVTKPYIKLIQALLEILRRGVWSVFRIENENINNLETYRKFDFVPSVVIEDE